MKEIVLTKGKVTQVSDCDFTYLMKWKWFCTADGYAARSLWLRGPRGRMLMHRDLMFIMGFVPKHTDHIDGDRLNNTRENLRCVSCSENLRNRGPTEQNTSGFKGVGWHKQRQKWRARIMIDYKEISLGLFDSRKEAAKAYNKGAIKYHGEFAWLNKV